MQCFCVAQLHSLLTTGSIFSRGKRNDTSIRNHMQPISADKHKQCRSLATIEHQLNFFRRKKDIEQKEFRVNFQESSAMSSCWDITSTNRLQTSSVSCKPGSGRSRSVQIEANIDFVASRFHLPPEKSGTGKVPCTSRTRHISRVSHCSAQSQHYLQPKVQGTRMRRYGIARNFNFKPLTKIPERNDISCRYLYNSSSNQTLNISTINVQKHNGLRLSSEISTVYTLVI